MLVRVLVLVRASSTAFAAFTSTMAHASGHPHGHGHKRMPESTSDLALAHSVKIPKIEPGLAQSPQAYARPLPNNDFSGSVKKRLATSSRTGQACDRCKVRLHALHTAHDPLLPTALAARV